MATTDYEPNVVLSTKEYDVVGTRPIRHDGADKVTGRALYGADFQTAGLLHGKILRSPHPHARIKSIDTTKAAALPGVRAVITAKDLPKTKRGLMVNYGEGDTSLDYLRENVLAHDKEHRVSLDVTDRFVLGLKDRSSAWSSRPACSESEQLGGPIEPGLGKVGPE